MEKNILFIPLDERPCNWSFSQKLINSIDGYNLIEPSKSILGDKKTPSNFSLLKDFILENVSRSQVAIVSVDQLLYGGVVPSRIHHLSAGELEKRLSVLKEIKKINPSIILYCFVLIMRCPQYSSSDEEPDYYEEYGKTINMIGNLIEKNKDYSALLDDKLGLFLQDYIDRRKINLSMVKKTVELTNETIDFLVIPQDDSQISGFTMMDRSEVFKSLPSNIDNKILIYSGADEVGLTLLTRAINYLENKSKRIHPNFLFIESKKLVPAYENKPLFDTFIQQIKASGNIISNYNDADIVIFMNYDEGIQYEASTTPKDIAPPSAYYDKQIDDIKRAMSDKKIVSLVDKTYVNGGNLKYMYKLSQQIELDDLDVYAGWNTSSNSIGTVISFSTIISYQGKTNQSKLFLAERIYDDLIYQAYARKYITNNILPPIGLNYFDIKKDTTFVQKITKQIIEEFAKNNFPKFYDKYHIKELTMPWKRMFEIGLEIEK